MAKEVTIYTTPTCGYCEKAKEFFKEHNVEYQELDVAADEENRNAMIEKSGQMGVPVIAIDGEYVIGFDEDRLSEALGIS